MTDDNMSMYDQVASTPQGAAGLAAAQLAARTAELLAMARHFSSMSYGEIAVMLNVTEERVAEVFSGDGNVHMATFARYMRAMGYEVDITATRRWP